MDRRRFITSSLALGFGGPFVLEKLASAAAAAGTKVLRMGYAAPVQTLDPI
jgi:hypothetical protein